MKKFYSTSLGRLRLAGFFEGLSLIVLMGFAMPMKYLFQDPIYVRMIGSIHGALFVLFILLLFLVSSERDWKWSGLPLKLFISCLIPFGTFYIDHKFLKQMDHN